MIPFNRIQNYKFSGVLGISLFLFSCLGIPEYFHIKYHSGGVSKGQKMESIPVRTLDGRLIQLSSAWAKKPALIVTVSLTCPIARNNVKKVNRLAEQFNDDLSVLLLYVIEAHPQTDPSPYSGEEWVTYPNKRNGIIHRQPTTLDERITLAKKFRKLSKLDVPIVIDDMDNRAWEIVGKAPNLGILVSPSGEVMEKQGWFKWRKMEKAIEILTPASTYRFFQSHPPFAFEREGVSSLIRDG